MATFRESIDHISARVGACGLTGAVAGSLVGLHKGHQSVFRTTSLTSFSCALAATACFGTERVFYTASQTYLLHSAKQDDDERSDAYAKNVRRLRLASHAAGGLFGGAWIGTLYFQRSLRGALLFTPIMIAISLVEERVMQSLNRGDFPLEEHQRVVNDVESDASSPK